MITGNFLNLITRVSLMMSRLNDASLPTLKPSAKLYASLYSRFTERLQTTTEKENTFAAEEQPLHLGKNQCNSTITAVLKKNMLQRKNRSRRLHVEETSKEAVNMIKASRTFHTYMQYVRTIPICFV